MTAFGARSFVTVAAAAAVLVAGPAQAGWKGPLVVRALGPSMRQFPLGATLGKTVTLRDGDVLIVLNDSGTRTLRGAGHFDLVRQTSTARPPSTLTALLRVTGPRVPRTGAVRGAGAADITGNLWAIDPSRAGTVCLPTSVRATMARSAVVEPVTLAITRVEDGKSVPITFSVGQAIRSWPIVDFPLSTGASFLVRHAGGVAIPITVALIELPEVTAQSVAAALISRGCIAQLDQLIAAGQDSG